MRVLGTAVLQQFARKHPASRGALQRFIKTAHASSWGNLIDVRATFNTADIGNKTGKLIFDIGGNKYRLIAGADFSEQILVIDRILTHEQYGETL